ncbi:MAG TPA: cbb3-type cytochrome c oxidase subunit 3 [Alphaproteobacteria bacterium]|nr:cbb3-type cytochrome c oxidase subunit 3 [Alphaproteobacteria bacterium]HOO50341.1 cbb3-type cytochrome c oxidase subunit 3 [Alphaproteobacteria bacterium]
MNWLFDHAPMIGLIFFVVFFTVMTIWLYRPSKKKHFENFANIPFSAEHGEKDRKEARDE